MREWIKIVNESQDSIPFEGIVYHCSNDFIENFRVVSPKRGIYFANEPDGDYGIYSYECRVKLNNAMYALSSDNFEIDRQVLISNGYDGRIVDYKEEADYEMFDVVAFYPHQIEILEIKKNQKQTPLLELFDGKQPWVWDNCEIHCWSAKFTIDNLEYYVVIDGFPKSVLEHNTAKVKFAAITQTETGSGPSYGITNQGNALKVFSTVIDIIIAYVKERQPETIEFEARYDEPSRVTLYRKMARFLKVPKYTFAGESASRVNAVFKFVRTEI